MTSAPLLGSQKYIEVVNVVPNQPLIDLGILRPFATMAPIL